jgi:carbon-monoxide dehydrogenase large subunit
MSILGNRVLRREDPAMLTVGGTYVEDIDLPGATYVTYVRSTMAHAAIASIDIDDALAAPGVLTIDTAADLAADEGFRDARVSPMLNGAMKRPTLATDTVRFVGEPVVAIVTEARYQGLDAAEQVVIDYDPLEPVLDPEAALADDALRLFPDADDNVALEIAARNMHADFDDCEVVVTQRMTNQKVAAAPLEGRAAAARWTDDGRLEQWVSCQGAHPMRDTLANAYLLEPGQVRVVCPDVGGGFGAKSSSFPEDLLLGVLARRVGRPVKWVESRTDNLTAGGHGRAQIQDVIIGGSRDGRITAYRLEVVQDSGAYPMFGAILPFMTRTMLTGVYDITNAEFSSRSAVTNTSPIVSYRGAGRPEATAAIERSIDLFAAEIGMDPAEVRRRNFIPPEAFPLTTVGGADYDCGEYTRALDLALEAGHYEALRAEQAERRAAGDTVQLGIGLSTYVEITAFGGGAEFGSVELQTDGSVLVKTGSNPYGQGHHTAWSQLVSDRLGLPFERITVVHGDTDVVPSGAITGGSRSVQIAGAAVWDAAGNLLELSRERAADLLEASIDDIDFDLVEGRFHVAGVPAVAVSWADLGAAGSGTDAGDALMGLGDFTAAGATFPFGAHLAVVEVDTETGSARLRSITAVDDAGRLLNPLLADGQVHGGLAQGVAQALYEEIRYDDDGNPLTSNFADYSIISACELPMFDRIAMETPTPMNELGAKGIGESGTIGSTPAVWNAVIDALSPFGVHHIDMPCTPEKIWRAINAG